VVLRTKYTGWRQNDFNVYAYPRSFAAAILEFIGDAGELIDPPPPPLSKL
jgi:hypothetical protein